MNKTYGDAIGYYLKLRGWNQTRLSEETGISMSLISGYMTGKREPTYHSLVKLAVAFKIYPSYLVAITEMDKKDMDIERRLGEVEDERERYRKMGAFDEKPIL